MSEQDQQIAEFMQKGIAAAKAGDKATARTFFERVVEKDKNSEKGWFWLASVVESKEERRVCLGNVLFLNPNNERARRLLEKLEVQSVEGKAAQKPIFRAGDIQVDRRALLIGGGVGAVVILLLLVAVLGRGGGGPQAALATPTVPTNTSAPTATRTLVPTFTPSPTPTVVITNTPEPLPTPSGIPGRLVFGSGPRFYVDRFLPIHHAGTDGNNRVTVGSEAGRTRGRNPVFSPDGRNILYELGLTDGSSRLRMVDLLGEDEVFITDDAVREAIRIDRKGTPIPILEPVRFGSEAQPAWSPNRSIIAFAGTSPASLIRQIYLLTISADRVLVTRVTDNEFDNTWPAWSPDGRRLVYVTDRRARGGVDLHIINADGTGDVNLTIDGNDLIERAPDWSPDGRRVVFEATGPDNGDRKDFDAYDSDIYIIDDVTVGSAPRLLFPPEEENEAETARDMLPCFSPDGRYMAFTSNRSGNWEIYILRIDTGEVFQVTNSPQEIDIIGDWGSG